MAARGPGPLGRTSAPLYLVFLLGGGAALGYELVWARMLAPGLGHEMPAVLSVVAAFFGGFALGAWLLDGAIRRSRCPGRWFGWLEFVAGLWGAATLRLIPWLNRLASGWIGIEPDPVWHWFVAFVAPAVVLAPATVALGATWPAMERWVAARSAHGRCVGGLYAASTAGAVLGVVGITFWWMPVIGFGQTLAILAAVHLMVGVAVLQLTRGATPIEVSEHRPGPVHTRATSLGPAIFAIGLLGIAYETCALRLLARILDNTVYSFALVLAAYLLGTSLGAFLVRRLVVRGSVRALLRPLLVGVSLSCVAGCWAVVGARPLSEALRARWGEGFPATVALESLLALAAFLIPTTLMGAVFAILVQEARARAGRVGRAIALNSLGAMLAPVLFGVALVPRLGIRGALGVVALGYLVPVLRRTPGMLGTAVTVMAGCWLLPVGLLDPRSSIGEQVVHRAEGVMASVEVVQDVDGDRLLSVNGRFAMGGTRTARAQRRDALLAVLLHPTPRRTLFLGVGTGITFGAVAVHPRLEGEAVELVPEVVDALPWFDSHNGVLRHQSRLRVRVADARRFVRATPRAYDVIVADLFHPARDGAGTLYTREHFAAIRRRLDDGGLFCQWLPVFQLSDAMLRVITRTFVEVFPHARLVLSGYDLERPVVGLVGTLVETRYGADWLETRGVDERLRAALEEVSLARPCELFGSVVAGSEQLRDYAGGARLNTDDHPVVLFEAMRDSALQPREVLELLRGLATDPAEWVAAGEGADEFVRDLNEFVEARDLFLEGLVLELEGNGQRAVSAWLAAAGCSSQFGAAQEMLLEWCEYLAASRPQRARELLERLQEACPEVELPAGLRELLGRQR